MSLRRLKHQHYYYHTQTHAHTHTTHTQTDTKMQRTWKSTTIPTTNTSDRWMTKGCEGMGGKKQQQERAAPTAYKKRISADMRHMGGRELARNECFKRRSLAQLRETCGVWGWCQNGEIFNTDGALKTTTTVIYLKARDKETGLDYMHVFVLFFVFVQARDWYEMNSRRGEGAETERFWRPRVWFKTLPTEKCTLESQPRRKDESPSIKASRLWREWRIVVWRWEAASSKQMADVLIQSPLWWGRWFMGGLVVRQDTKWPNSLRARLCTEDKNQHFLPCGGGFFCEYLCDNFFSTPLSLWRPEILQTTSSVQVLASLSRCSCWNEHHWLMTTGCCCSY